jgi:hypothetical protein
MSVPWLASLQMCGDYVVIRWSHDSLKFTRAMRS